MRIQYFVMDVDGTLTDGKIYMGKEGELCKAFNIKDGYGIHDILIPAGIEPVIITGRVSQIVSNRCTELGIDEIHQGVGDKTKKIKEIVPKDFLSAIAYIGDDLNDLALIQEINELGGITACPLDAVETIKKSVQYITAKNGGEGAVRDFIDWLKDKNWNAHLEK